MTNTELMELLTVADTIENNGGWNIAAVKIRALVAAYKQLEAKIDDLRAVADTKGVRSEEMAEAVYRVLSASGGAVNG